MPKMRLREAFFKGKKEPTVNPLRTEQPKKSKKEYKNREKKLKFTYAEQKEFETIDEDIAKLEEQIEQAEADILANAKDFVKLQELTEKKEELQEQLDYKMERWVYLNDLAEQIEAEKRSK